MKTLLITDSHGRNPADLINRSVEEEGIETLAMLGDLDTPDILKSIRESAQQRGLRFIYTPGNHEYHYVYREKLKGITLAKTLQGYAQEWDMAPIEKQFLLTASKDNNSDASLIVRDNKIVYAHASLIDCPSRINLQVTDIIWGRVLNDPKLLELNLEFMKKNDFRLFFRGHDHAHAIQSYDGNSIKQIVPIVGKYHVDFENSRTIATIGAFFNGDYAVYDSKNREIDFRKSESK